MDLQKMGSFIASCRKQQNMTQQQLAEKLSVTNQAVSKWETGKGAPDSSIMLALCDALKISVTDLLCGEIVTQENYDRERENKLLELVAERQNAHKQLLRMEILLGSICIAGMLLLCVIAAYAQIADWLRIVLILVGMLPVLVATPFMLKIEQTAGYYECAQCGHRYVPGYKSVFMSAHMGRTRYMRCPRCGRRSWQKKVLTKE